ncbi:conserved Plasmodium protein, unknown function [Plasmodium ovale]|nr:conserved Plasmodium protein, unknown function [Plasmodium ovale]
MNTYMPKSFDEILVNPKDRLSVLTFLIKLIKFNNDPVLSRELENLCNIKQDVDVFSLKNICVILGVPGSGKTTLLKYLCQKLNIRECYYEAESQEHINFVRNANEEDENQRYYYHPYNNFLLYSSCQIGNTEKGEIAQRKFCNRGKWEDALREEPPKKGAPNDDITLIESFSNINKRRIFDRKENWHVHKMTKLCTGSSSRMAEVNTSSESLLHDMNHILKKRIVENLVEGNIFIGTVSKGFFKLFNIFVNILHILNRKNREREYEEGETERDFMSPFMCNNLGRRIHKNCTLATQMWVKITNVLLLSHNLKEQILENCKEDNVMEKKIILDLFVDGNYSEHIINNLNQMSNLHEHVNTIFAQSNSVNKLVINILKEYNNWKEKINDDFSLANTLCEELNHLIVKKYGKRFITIETFKKCDFLYKQREKDKAVREIYKGLVSSNILLETRDSNIAHPDNLLNRDVRHFVETNKCREIIKVFIESEKMNFKFGEYINIVDKLDQRTRSLETIEKMDINLILHDLDMTNGAYINVENESAWGYQNSGNVMDLLAINNHNEWIINSIILNHSLRGLTICNEFIMNCLTNIVVTNKMLVKYLKGEAVNNLVRENNSMKRMDGDNSAVGLWKLDEAEGYRLPTSCSANETGQSGQAAEEANSHMTSAFGKWDQMKTLFENEYDEMKKSTIQFLPDAQQPSTIPPICADATCNNFHMPDKLLKKVIDYSREIYKLHKKIVNSFVKCDVVLREIISLLKKDNNLKRELLLNVVKDVNICDMIISSFVSINLEKMSTDYILNSSLYRYIMNMNLKKKREEEKKKIYYDKNYICTRAVILDELPLSELEYSEEFRKSCTSSMEFILNRVNYCKQEYLKCNDKNNESKKKKNIECYAIHPIIILINSFEQIKTVNTLLGIDINYSPYVLFIKLKKVHPLYLEKMLSQRYYCRMINLNKNVKDIIKRFCNNCNGDIRSCFNALDFLNRIPDLSKMSLHEISNVSVLCQNDIFGFARKVLCAKTGFEAMSRKDLHMSTCIKQDMNYSNYTPQRIHKGGEYATTTGRDSKGVITNTGSDDDDDEGEEQSIRKAKLRMRLYKELDENVDVMTVSEKFQVLTLLKENFLFFYSSLPDIARLFSNLSLIDYSFRGIDCSNLSMRKSYDNLNDDIARFVNDHFRLTYRYYVMCNSNTKGVIASNAVALTESHEKWHSNLVKKEKKIENSEKQPCLVRIFFPLKTNSMNKYYHHFSIVRKELYDRYIMIVIRKLMNQNVDATESIASKYAFLLRGNHELFSCFFPCYILLTIEHWNYMHLHGGTDVNGGVKIDGMSHGRSDGIRDSEGEPSQNGGFYVNKFFEIVYNFRPQTGGDSQRHEHVKQVISFAETFVTPKFIALFFPSYLIYLINGTKQKLSVRKLIGNQAVSTETYFEMRNLLRLHDMELYNYFFFY